MFKIHMYSSPYLLLYYDDNHIHLYQISQLFLLKKIHLKTSYYSILIRARRSHMIDFNEDQRKKVNLLKIGFIGFGNMAQAIATGLIESQLTDPADLYFSESYRI